MSGAGQYRQYHSLKIHSVMAPNNIGKRHATIPQPIGLSTSSVSSIRRRSAQCQLAASIPPLSHALLVVGRNPLAEHCEVISLFLPIREATTSRKSKTTHNAYVFVILSVFTRRRGLRL